MARFAQERIEDLRARADIVEVVGAQVRLKRAGRNFVGLCPFHQEKTPSFTVSPERGFFHCFGCGAGGTVFNFVMRAEGLTFPQAVRSLARRYGVELPESEEPGARPGEREAMERANALAADFFAHVLWKTADGAPAREYLDARAIGADAAHAFHLGFAPGRPAALANALERRGLLDAAVKLGLVRRDAGGSFDMFRARLIFPIRDAVGRVLGFGGRVLDNGRSPKYINSPESPLYSKGRALYGLFESRRAIVQADRAIIVEGYIDAIAIHQAGFKEVVASLGTSLTIEQARLVGRHTRNLLACFDGDQAGRTASMRALEVLLQAGLSFGRAVFIPEGFDPDSLIQRRGAAAFAQLVDNAELLMDLFVREQAMQAGKDFAQRARAAERVVQILALIGNPFEFDLLSRKAATALGVSEDVLRGQARRAPARGAPGREARKPAAGTAPDAAETAYIGLLAIALLYPELRAHILERLARNGFGEDGLAAVLMELCGLPQSSRAEAESRLSERLSDEQQSRLSGLIVGTPLEDRVKAQALADEYLAALRRGRDQRAVEELRRDIGRLGPDEATAAAQAIIALRRQSREER